MKKLLSKIDHVPTGYSQGSCIGRSWTLGKYTVQVDEIIAEGGFGVVFLARSGSTKYALKRIIVNNEVDLAVATREIQIMSSLGEHPNILACLDYLITPLGGGLTETLCLMPFCRGSLLSLLNEKMAAKTHVSEKEALQIMGDIVSAVGRLHLCATPIIHRDLKIENVLMDLESGKVVLCDFGSATPKFWDPSVHGTTATQEDLEKYTTLAYRSPEMVDLYSNRGPITCKSDIWALGILLYKICYYTTPFGDSILAIQSANVTFPSNSPFSNHIHALIQYLLTPDPAARPDIFQVAELVFTSFLGSPNPLTNVNNTPPPPSIETLVNMMNNMAVVAKAKAEEKHQSKSSSVTPAPPLETTVTPRQRPKGSIVLPTVSAGGAGLLPPPKSPKPIDMAPPPLPLPVAAIASGHSSSGSNCSGASSNNVNNNSNSNTNQAPLTVPSSQTQLPPPNEIGHRRNASDSSAFEKGLALPPTNDISTCCSAEANLEHISSWNPFEDDSFVDSGGAASSNNAATTFPPVDPIGGNELTNQIHVEEDDPFSRAPFDHFKYRPMGVDSFGQRPFSNPFLEFSTPVASGQLPVDGVSNLSFEDER